MHVPRARKVGQSWLTTPFTSLQCLVGSMRAILVKPLPDAVYVICDFTDCRCFAMVLGLVSYCALRL